MENAVIATTNKKTLVKNYPLDFLIIGPKENDQLEIILQSSAEDAEHYGFDSKSILSDLQRRVTEWNKIGSGKIDIGQHISNQYTDHVLSTPRIFKQNAADSTTTVKSGQPLNINLEAYDSYFYVWQGSVSASDRNKIQKEFTQHIPDIVKSLEQDDKQDDDDQLMQYLEPIVNMSIDATQAFAARTRQVQIARVIFISLAIVVLFAYVQFK